MAINTPLKGAGARRPLPPARVSSPRYEIVFKRTPSPRSVLRNVFETIGSGVSWGAEVLGAAYTAGARVVFERIETIEDFNAERRAQGRIDDVSAPAAKGGELPRSQ